MVLKEEKKKKQPSKSQNLSGDKETQKQYRYTPA